MISQPGPLVQQNSHKELIIKSYASLQLNTFNYQEFIV